MATKDQQRKTQQQDALEQARDEFRQRQGTPDSDFYLMRFVEATTVRLGQITDQLNDFARRFPGS